MTSNEFLKLIKQNNYNRILLERLPRLNLPQTYLVAGCLFQTVWNLQKSRPAKENIKDYDVFYFDDSDLSYEAEDKAIKQAEALAQDLPIRLELKNQARVHLWYREHFGHDYPRLGSSQDGIDRYLIAGTCLGIEVRHEEVYAPYGFEDMRQGILRANPKNLAPELFRAKADSYQKRWPHLVVVE